MAITLDLKAALDAFEPDDYFPHSSILGKIAVHSPDSWEQIVTRAGEIEKYALNKEISLITASTQKNAPLETRIFKSLSDNLALNRIGLLASLFKAQIMSNQESTPALDFINTYKILSDYEKNKLNRASKGDNFRQAIIEFMDRNEIDPDDIGLTSDELKSLKYLIPLPFARSSLFHPLSTSVSPSP